MNRDLALLVQWLRSNKISVNTSKTEVILFKNKNKDIPLKKFSDDKTKSLSKKINFRLSGQKLNTTNNAKYLGLILDEHLIWDTQLHNLSIRSRSVGILAKLRHYLDYKTLLSVYYALFDSQVNYCIQCLGFVTQESFDKIESLQNKALRIIHFKSNRDSVKPLYVKSRILPIRKQLVVKNCLFAYDFFHNKLP